MQTVVITIELPDNGAVAVRSEGALAPADAGAASQIDPGDSLDVELVEEYWEFITSNTRKLFGAMAQHQVETGGEPFSMQQIADRLEEPLSSVQSYNRNGGRGARLWRDRKNVEPPIDLVHVGYVPGKNQGTFRFPDGVAEVIVPLL